MERAAGQRAERTASGTRRHVATHSSPTQQAHRDPTGLLALQRLAGNRAVSGLVELSLRDVDHPFAHAVTRGDLRYRLPDFSEVRKAYTSTTMRIPEEVVKDRVGKLLERMKAEGRLRKNNVPVAQMVAEIFPATGISQKAFKRYLDVTDQEVIYGSVLDAETQVKGPDKAGLRAEIANARGRIATVRADDAGLLAVFGSKRAEAKENYRKARVALAGMSANLDANVTTDYNRDAPEVGLGGWAQFSTGRVHLLAEIAQVADPIDTQTTLIHESSHLADSSVDDLGYYGSHGFEAMSEDDKLHNAAHYEELPRRLMGTSLYPAPHIFTPGVMAAGGHATRKDRILRRASEHLRKAWDAAVDVHSLIRGVRAAQENGNWAPWHANEALILQISALMDLTIHRQDPVQRRVVVLDVTLTESIARAMTLIQEEVDNVAVPGRPMAELYAKRKVIARAVAAYGHLLGNANRDKRLVSWLKAHYHQVPSP